MSPKQMGSSLATAAAAGYWDIVVYMAVMYRTVKPRPKKPLTGRRRLTNVFPLQSEYYAFFTDFALTFRTALDDLEKYLQEEGPFDAVIGFSQGACLAATLMIRHAQKQPSQSIFRCAVFICGIEPWNIAEGRNYSVTMDGEVISVPTATIYGSKDYQWGDASLALSKLCNSESKEIYDHGRAHEVPRSSELTSGMARTIRKVIDKALYLH
ncbi:hypothetical protein MMC26_003194 [Xylographa opegraphella]|nr:hypothetical protein [Xylographa opegraphella]